MERITARVWFPAAASLNLSGQITLLHYKQHRKMGMRDLGTFVHEKVPHIAFKYPT